MGKRNGNVVSPSTEELHVSGVKTATTSLLLGTEFGSNFGLITKVSPVSPSTDVWAVTIVPEN